jgi:RHS repeat-associated protein
VRVRIVGTDGSMSEAAESCLRIECGGPQVVSAEYDRTVNSLTITFNREIDRATVVVGSTLLLDRDDLPVSGSVAQASGTTFVVTPAEDLTQSSFRLAVTTGVQDTSGNALRFAFTQSFTLGGVPIDVPPGHGYITGEVYDATTGRPLQGASVLGAPTSSSVITDLRGRYAMALPEGAHTIEVTAPGHTTVWRQVVVPAGTGIVPIDIRLTARGSSASVASTDLTLTHGGDTPVTTPVTLTVPSGSLTTGSTVTLTSVGTQSLAGLLPLGWSPLAGAEVVASDASSAAKFSPRPAPAGRGAGGEGSYENLTTTPLTATLTFQVPGAAITAAAQTLTAVRYDATRDQWQVLDAAVNITNDTATINITSDGPYALVYPDKGPGLATPPAPAGGTALVGIADPCATPAACGELIKDAFTLDPPVVLPDQRTTATLRADSTLGTQHSALPPSGTAVQAYIDEELQLADGSTVTDPPFATDLLLYRGLDGGAGEARFHLAPSKRAADVILQVGYENIRVHPYPGRLDRGTLIGNEGGRVPGDGTVSIDIPEGAALEPVHASVAQVDVSGLTLEGYTVLGGFDFTLARASSAPPQDLDGDGQPDPIAPVQLFKPASMTYVVDKTQLPSPDAQVILAEVLSGENAGIVRLTALMSDATSSARTAPQSGRSFQLRPDAAENRAASSQPVPAEVESGRSFQLRPDGAEDRTASSSRTSSSQPLPAEVENFGHLTAETAVRYTTQLPTTALPVDGLTREGTYLVLAANQPIAYATGLVRLGSPTGPIAANAQVTTSPLPLGEGSGMRVLGVNDLVRPTGIYAIPVPAASFALTPSSPTLGAGTPHEHATAVATASIHDIQLVLAPQPPAVVATTPANGATEVPLGTVIQIELSRTIDPASVTPDSITVTNTTTGTSLSGSTTVAGQFLTWTRTPMPEPMAPGSRYTVTLAPTIRATTGAPLGTTYVFTFATITELTSTEINRDRIRITIPDESGTSIVSGTAGAIPAGWQAIPVRRLRDFTTRYQTTAAADGSFSVTIGIAAGDQVSITDTIDLHLVNTSGILAAVIRLTPFVSADGKAFIAPPDRETRFTSADNITVTVPAGAFDEPTEIRVQPGSRDRFDTIPNFEEEWNAVGGVELQFSCGRGASEGGPCQARQPLVAEFPAPEGAVPGLPYLLGRFGESTRGPRMMIVDQLDLVDGRFSNARAREIAKVPATVSAKAAAGTTVVDGRGSKLRTAGVLTGKDAARYLISVSRDGNYLAVIHDALPGVGLVWMAMDGGVLDVLFDAWLEVFITAFHSLYAADWYLAEGNDYFVMPVLEGRPFTVSGVDASTGFDLFQQDYDPISEEPGSVVVVPDPNQDVTGPYPIHATPFRIERFTLRGSLTAIPQFIATLENDRVVISTVLNRLPKVAEGTALQALNTRTGVLSSVASVVNGEATLSLKARRFDEIILFVGETNVREDTPIAVVFNEPVWVPSVDGGTEDDDEAWLASVIRLRQVKPAETDLTPHARFVRDSGGRRVHIELPSRLASGGLYRLTLSHRLTDLAGNPLARGISADGAGQPVVSGGLSDITLEFRVGEPAGVIGSFELRPSEAFPGAALRDMARFGNLAFVTLLDGGILAYDLGLAGSLAGSGAPEPVALVPGRWSDSEGRVVTPGMDQQWAVATDHHGRVVSTGFSGRFGVVRSYRVEDFLAAKNADLCEGYPEAPSRANCRMHGSSIVSWRPGYTQSLNTASQVVISDRPEAIPRRVQLLHVDHEEVWSFDDIGDAYEGFVTNEFPGQDFREVAITVPYRPDAFEPYYLSQRITIENRTLGGRWSADVPAFGRAVIEGVIGRPGDRIAIVRNERTYLLTTLFGYGVALHDLNAIESNDKPDKPADYKPFKEQLVLTKGEVKPSDLSPIRDLSLSPESIAIPGTDARAVTAFASDVHRGLVGLTLGAELGGAARGFGLILRNPATGELHPRLATLEALVGDRARIRPRFGPLAYYSGVGPDGLAHDYILAAGGGYGVLAVRADKGGFLNMEIGPDSLAGIAWIPSGAYAVRTIEGTGTAVVVDGEGRVILLDVTRLDEFDQVEHDPSALFPTTREAILGVNHGAGVGSVDPRILWISDPGMVAGTIPPVVDPSTGVILTGEVLGKTMRILSSRQPRVDLLLDLDGSGALTSASGVVPLGVDAAWVSSQNGSAAAFRLQAILPGGAADALEALGRQLAFAIESERRPGAVSEQTGNDLPPAHLRSAAPDGTSEPRSATILMRRAIPQGATAEESKAIAERLRHQPMFNRYLSPWIVAVGDPRASEHFQRPQGFDPKLEGCNVCSRPERLRGLAPSAGVFELWTAGHTIAVRPDGPAGVNAFAGTEWEWLGDPGALSGRFRTVPGARERSDAVYVAPQNPPVAQGLFQETIYLHSGELETSHVDLVAEGRAGIDVVIERHYRSRQYGSGPFGPGWDSPMFQWLRELPSGDVELRDGRAGQFLFRRTAGGFPSETEALLGATIRYASPPGLFVSLVKTARGWTLYDQQWRVKTFDSLGRLVSEADEFWHPVAGAGGEDVGNVIHYVYDDRGRLAGIIDPVGRETRIQWWSEGESGPGAFPGRVKSVSDWRGRDVRYEYDAAGRLERVRLPEVFAAPDVPAELSHAGTKRPTIVYSWEAVPPPGASEPMPSARWTRFLELGDNLVSITDPSEAAATNGFPRVRWEYDTSTDPARRDRVMTEIWPCGTTATGCVAVTSRLPFSSGLGLETIDALGQRRSYELTESQGLGGVHFRAERELAVPLVGLGSSPLSAAPVLVPDRTATLETRYEAYDENGLLRTRVGPDGLTTTWAHKYGPSGAPGAVVKSMSEIRDGLRRDTEWRFDDAPNAAANVMAVGRRAGAEGPYEFRDAQVPSRNRTTVAETDEGIRTSAAFDPRGQLTSLTTGAPGMGEDSARTAIEWNPPTGSFIARGRTRLIAQGAVGSRGTEYAFEHESTPGGGRIERALDKMRGVETRTVYDAWDRPVQRIVTGPDGAVFSDDRFGFDATGRLAYRSRIQTGAGRVEERFTWDPYGRLLESSSSHNAVGDTLATLHTSARYDMAAREIQQTDPYQAGRSDDAAVTSTRLDPLGRVIATEKRAASGAAYLRTNQGWNESGEIVWQSDGVRTALVRTTDAFGRETATLASDGTRTESDWTAWDELAERREYASAATGGALVARTGNAYSSQGRLRASWNLIEPQGRSRSTRYSWDDGGRTRGTRTGETIGSDGTFAPLDPVRAEQRLLDEANRVVETRIGSALGPDGALADDGTFLLSRTLSFAGDLPVLEMVGEPRAGAEYSLLSNHDALGRLVASTQAGAYTETLALDEAGNLVAHAPPGLGSTAVTRDARGLPRAQSLPDRASIIQHFDELSGLTNFVDEDGVVTNFERDGLGRLTRIVYPDATFEQLRYEAGTGLIEATRDRAGQWLSMRFDPAGRITSVHVGETADGPPVESFSYDGAGRLTRAANRDAAIEYADFDLLGRPRLTRTIRYANGSGLTASPAVLDVHVQGHAWSAFEGERQRWRMPAAGWTLPSGETATSWLEWIDESRDAVGNVVVQREALGPAAPASGAVIAESLTRGPGRVVQRTRGAVTERFGYADGETAASRALIPVNPPSAGVVSGLPGNHWVEVGGLVVSGTEVRRDASRRIAASVRLGAGERESRWSYDDRARLASVLQNKLAEAQAGPGNAIRLSAADFQEGRSTTGRLMAAQAEQLGAAAASIAPHDYAIEEGAAHQPLTMRRELGGEVLSETSFAYQGGRRVSDGVWVTQYDFRGRLTSMTNVRDGRRIELIYDPNGRIAGRTALRLEGENWVTEDRAAVIDEDGVSAETTWVWDPVADRLVAIYEAGRSLSDGATPEAGLFRQVLHGDLAMDDPVEVRVRAGGTSDAPVARRLYPVLDHVTDGSLSTVIDGEGHVVERTFYADAFGDAPRFLDAPVIDRVSLHQESGSRQIRVQVSEILDAATVPGSVRLVAGDGSASNEIVLEAQLRGGHTIVATISEPQWQDVRQYGVVEIVVTGVLRSRAWGETAVRGPPAWMISLGTVRSEAGRPFVYAATPSNLDAGFGEGAAGGAGVALYELHDLYLAASPRAATKLNVGFHGYPWREPASGLVFARERWYDPATAQFLTPDPLGYQDSSNLYAFAANDPANLRDPLGLSVRTWLRFLSSRQGDEAAEAMLRRHGRELGEETGEAARRLARPMGDEALEYLVSARRAERYNQLLRRVQASGAKTVRPSQSILRDPEKLQRFVTRQRAKRRGFNERLAELQGRVDMIAERNLKLGPGKYSGNKGIDAVFFNVDNPSQLSILESKWRKDFALDPLSAANPETLMGRGIKNPRGPGYLRQMSPDWIREVQRRLVQSDDPSVRLMGRILARHANAERYVNVLNQQGRSIVRKMP